MISRITILYALCVVAQATSARSLAGDPEGDQTVAIVNGEAITAAEVTLETPSADRSSPEARRLSLEKLIDRTLLLQAIKKMGVAPPKAFAEEQIDTIVKEEFHGDRARFAETLNKQGYTLESFEKRQEDNILEMEMRRFIGKSEPDPAARKRAVAGWLAAARSILTITYK